MFATVEEAILEIRGGRMVILVDDEDRENEGDLTMAAERVTPETVNFMARHGRGLICVSLTNERAGELDLHPMVPENTARMGTAFTVSVDAKRNVTTGISAADRAETIRQMVDPATKPSDLARPGHVFPLRAKDGGVLVRTGQTEGSVDLARLAGLKPAGVICEIMNPDGTMARVPELTRFAREHGLKIVTIRDLVEYRMRRESIIEQVTETTLPTRFGTFVVKTYQGTLGGEIYLALILGDPGPNEDVLVRVHSQCLTGDVFGSYRCDCGSQLHAALEKIGEEGKGVLLYVAQEGRGIGLVNKLKAYALQDEGLDTVQANEALGFKPDLRDYGLGAQVLADLGIKRMRLMTNNPRKIVGLEGYGLTVTERVPLEIKPREENQRYLATKREKLGHLLGNV
ncbi:MAG: bifunctional 3,4-dihydroxy-2-butanone-4-phosphate synthase/GTP cyclohydrolase II [Candidatus Tectomicrobia bacterium]|nr:bifunctional 3,4-dihydroxy-2-butanone-4-phosphate synthase/GTP cyclohydrolase II [Candidatus Tectomicrobia bacterium]